MIITTILLIFLYAYAVWLGYCAYLALKMALKRGTLKLFPKMLAYISMGVFGFMDLGLNIIFSVLVWDLPRLRGIKPEWMLSPHVKRFMRRVVINPNWIEKLHTKIGTFIGDVFLNPISQAVGDGDHV